MKALQKVRLSSCKQSRWNSFLELQKRKQAILIISGCESVSIRVRLHYSPPSSINPYIYPVLRLDSEWVTLLFTIFPIPSQVFGLAGSAALSLAITGLWGFSNGAFEEITLFSSSSREKSEDILARSVCSQSRQFCLTHLVAKISSDLV